MTEPKLNASSRIMYEEAKSRGIECIAFSDHETVLMRDGQHQWYVRGSRTSFQSSVGKTIADYKPLTKEVLRHFHFPTGKFVKVGSKEGLSSDVKKEISTLRFPIVMKPVAERHGKGVVVGLKSLAELETVYQPKTTVIVEEQLRGLEYRIVCVDFKFVAAAFRKPAHVVGDGKRTIEELVAEKNTHPWRGEGHTQNLTLIKIDETVLANLAEQNLKPTSIPAEGQEVLLRKTANLSTGGEAWNVSDQVHPENREVFEGIAKACDLNVVGIDVMCEALDQPFHEQPQAGIIEVNASPGLRMHHYPIQGEPVNVAAKILDSVMAHFK
ncbi:hypothetical protein H3C66_04660 [Patescibacteria group bacterium]|nr:hypothetical protein [Patescibacteria group bacterium]